MIDLNEDSKVEMVDTLFRRKDSYLAFEDAMPRNATITYERQVIGTIRTERKCHTVTSFYSKARVAYIGATLGSQVDVQFSLPTTVSSFPLSDVFWSVCHAGHSSREPRQGSIRTVRSTHSEGVSVYPMHRNTERIKGSDLVFFKRILFYCMSGIFLGFAAARNSGHV